MFLFLDLILLTSLQPVLNKITHIKLCLLSFLIPAASLSNIEFINI